MPTRLRHRVPRFQITTSHERSRSSHGKVAVGHGDNSHRGIAGARGAAYPGRWSRSSRSRQVHPCIRPHRQRAGPAVTTRPDGGPAERRATPPKVKDPKGRVAACGCLCKLRWIQTFALIRVLWFRSPGRHGRPRPRAPAEQAAPARGLPPRRAAPAPESECLGGGGALTAAARRFLIRLGSSLRSQEIHRWESNLASALCTLTRTSLQIVDELLFFVQRMASAGRQHSRHILP